MTSDLPLTDVRPAESRDRFGAAYKEELRIFLHCCLARQRFPVTHLDALHAQEIIAAAMTRVISTKDMAPIAYSKAPN